MLLAELIGVFIITLSVVYIYYKYVLLNYWRKKGVFYVEPTVPAGNLTPYVTGKVSVGEYLYIKLIIMHLRIFWLCNNSCRIL